MASSSNSKTSHDHSDKDSYSLMWITTLGLLTLLGPMSIDMYLPALPAIATQFTVSTSAISTSLPAYFLGLAIGQLIYGPISDHFGRKPPLYFGLTLFTVASVLCALTTQLEQLLLLRVVQALGGCVGMAMVRAAIRDRLSPLQSAKALSNMMLIMGIAPIIAPLIGGWLLVTLGWQSIFIFLACCGLASILLVHFKFDETLDIQQRPPLSLGHAFSNYAKILQDRSFLIPTLAGSLSYAAFFSYISAAPAILIDQFKIQPQFFGWYFGANAIGLIVFSQLNVRLVGHYRLARILSLGILIQFISGIWLLLWQYVEQINQTIIMLGLFGIVASIGLVSANSNALAMLQQGKLAGSASALQGALQFLISFTIVPMSHTLGLPPLLNLSLTVVACTLIGFLLALWLNNKAD